MELWINELWLLGTAIVFTFVGMWIKASQAMDITEAVIDTLIEQGYIKAIGTGQNMEIVKWRDWCDDQNSE